MQWVLAAVTLLLPCSVFALDVTTCGQTVPTGDVGVLQADLSECVDGVVLADRAVLDMAGHAISASHLGVQCIAPRCAVHGPGDISGAVVGIWGFYPNGRVEVT